MFFSEIYKKILETESWMQVGFFAFLSFLLLVGGLHIESCLVRLLCALLAPVPIALFCATLRLFGKS